MIVLNALHIVAYAVALNFLLIWFLQDSSVQPSVL
jgi:hypothetical protein